MVLLHPSIYLHLHQGGPTDCGYRSHQRQRYDVQPARPASARVWRNKIYAPATHTVTKSLYGKNYTCTKWSDETDCCMQFDDHLPAEERMSRVHRVTKSVSLYNTVTKSCKLLSSSFAKDAGNGGALVRILVLQLSHSPLSLYQADIINTMSQTSNSVCCGPAECKNWAIHVIHIGKEQVRTIKSRCDRTHAAWQAAAIGKVTAGAMLAYSGDRERKLIVRSSKRPIRSQSRLRCAAF